MKNDIRSDGNWRMNSLQVSRLDHHSAAEMEAGGFALLDSLRCFVGGLLNPLRPEFSPASGAGVLGRTPQQSTFQHK